MGIFSNLIDPGYVNPNPGADQTVAGNARANWNAYVSQPFEDFKSDVREQAKVLVEDAKNSITEPIRNLISSTAQIAMKAVPTALAASASLQYIGGLPSFASFLQPANLRSKYLRIGTNRSSRIGYPLEDFRVLNTLSGFVMCESARIEIPGTQNASGATLEEQQLITQYLENGCYIE